jgi:hypothetical protein
LEVAWLVGWLGAVAVVWLCRFRTTSGATREVRAILEQLLEPLWGRQLLHPFREPHSEQLVDHFGANCWDNSGGISAWFPNNFPYNKDIQIIINFDPRIW